MAERLTSHLAGVQERLRTAELASAAALARALEAVRKARASARRGGSPRGWPRPSWERSSWAVAGQPG